MLRHRSAESKPASANNGQSAVRAKNRIVERQTTNRTDGMEKSQPSAALFWSARNHGQKQRELASDTDALQERTGLDHQSGDFGQRFARYLSTPHTRPARPRKTTSAMKKTAASSLSGDQNMRPLANM